MKWSVVVLVFVLLFMSSCGYLTGKAYTKTEGVLNGNDVINMLNNNCIVAETGDEGKVTSCNEICSRVVVPGSDVDAKCVLGMVYRNDDSADRSTFYPCGNEFGPSRNDDGSLDSYLDCYCCTP
ncbi:MAG TPA: hypothetical protein VJI46_02910 [Candidatus Nanoarchaeia archaeon]|nr:hypothetical protein [Candidatus Nanoarchaeia archaeon]